MEATSKLAAAERTAVPRRIIPAKKTREAARPACDVAPSVRDALARGMARLVEGQRQFAEEFGLPYGRVFSDGYESFKGRQVEAAVRDWFVDEKTGADRLNGVFHDLVVHQMALLSALDGAVLEAFKDEYEVEATQGNLVLRWFRRLVPARRKKLDPTQRYLKVVAPAFVAAYAKAREQAAGASNFQHNQKAAEA